MPKTLIHLSRGIPEFDARWDPSDDDYVWMCWNAALEGASISSSTWTVPAGWTATGEQTAQPVTDDDNVTHQNCNGVRLTNTDAEAGTVHTMTNTVALSDGRDLSRSIKLRIADL